MTYTWTFDNRVIIVSKGFCQFLMCRTHEDYWGTGVGDARERGSESFIYSEKSGVNKRRAGLLGL